MFDYRYVQGYTAALMDVLDVMGDVQCDLKRRRVRQSYKVYKAMIECMLEGRAILRENPDAFVRYNPENEKGFEIYIEKQGVYDPKY